MYLKSGLMELKLKEYENKFLGVIIDDKLSWKSHINHVKTKMSKTIAILYKACPEQEIIIHTLLFSVASIYDLLSGDMG